ncbi:hypothetical protein C8Q76DRAFT_843566 [Earliella scabrosa]|nr:hypothetical protein C8Q76DRAFT_843566 [Earliella scabrosa]
METLQPKISESSRIYNPRRKAQKPVENTKGKKPVGRNVGKLLQIMNMPVDVFFEIASHLHPLDLLHLSRVSNELRDTLMSKKSRGVWIEARKRVEPPLPDCPDDLSEPQYASLVFERSCIVSTSFIPCHVLDSSASAIPGMWRWPSLMESQLRSSSPLLRPMLASQVRPVPVCAITCSLALAIKYQGWQYTSQGGWDTTGFWYA